MKFLAEINYNKEIIKREVYKDLYKFTIVELETIEIVISVIKNKETGNVKVIRKFYSNEEEIENVELSDEVYSILKALNISSSLKTAFNSRDREKVICGLIKIRDCLEGTNFLVEINKEESDENTSTFTSYLFSKLIRGLGLI